MAVESGAIPSEPPAMTPLPKNGPHVGAMKRCPGLRLGGKAPVPTDFLVQESKMFFPKSPKSVLCLSDEIKECFPWFQANPAA